MALFAFLLNTTIPIILLPIKALTISFYSSYVSIVWGKKLSSALQSHFFFSLQSLYFLSFWTFSEYRGVITFCDTYPCLKHAHNPGEHVQCWFTYLSVEKKLLPRNLLQVKKDTLKIYFQNNGLLTPFIWFLKANYELLYVVCKLTAVVLI